jgi:hypothetical protein
MKQKRTSSREHFRKRNNLILKGFFHWSVAQDLGILGLFVVIGLA